MGDRAMAEIRTTDGSLYVYTHWEGADLPAAAMRALKAAEPRWGDEPYATRIIVDQLTKEGRDKETGFGLMLKPVAEDAYNNDNPSVIIDLVRREVLIQRGETREALTFDDLQAQQAGF